LRGQVGADGLDDQVGQREDHGHEQGLQDRAAVQGTAMQGEVGGGDAGREGASSPIKNRQTSSVTPGTSSQGQWPAPGTRLTLPAGRTSAYSQASQGGKNRAS